MTSEEEQVAPVDLQHEDEFQKIIIKREEEEEEEDDDDDFLCKYLEQYSNCNMEWPNWCCRILWAKTHLAKAHTHSNIRKDHFSREHRGRAWDSPSQTAGGVCDKVSLGKIFHNYSQGWELIRLVDWTSAHVPFFAVTLFVQKGSQVYPHLSAELQAFWRWHPVDDYKSQSVCWSFCSWPSVISSSFCGLWMVLPSFVVYQYTRTMPRTISKNPVIINPNRNKSTMSFTERDNRHTTCQSCLSLM